MYCNASMTPVQDLRRWLKAVGDALDGMLRGGVTLNGVLELSRQWAAFWTLAPLVW